MWCIVCVVYCLCGVLFVWYNVNTQLLVICVATTSNKLNRFKHVFLFYCFL